MALASSSSIVVRYIKEATFGVTPVTGNSKEVRVTGESLDFAISKESSKEINASRGVSSMVPVDASTSGGLQMEMHYNGPDDFMESALQSTWSVFGTAGVGAATATSTITATTITASAATTGSNAFTLLKKGQWFRVSSAGANNGKILRVSSVTAPTTTIITLDTNTPAAASTAESIQIQSSRLTHGNTQTSFSIERENFDIDVHTVFRGQTPSKMNISIQSGALSTLSFDFMGKNADQSDATYLPGTPVAAPAYDIHSGVSGATNSVWLDGSPVTGTFVKSVSLDFDNALRNQGAIGSLGAVAIGSGTINCSASTQIYFANKDLFNKFKANTNTSLIFHSSDYAGNTYVITVPVANISTWKSNAGGKDADMMVDVSLTALIDAANTDPTLRRLIFIDRLGAAVV